MSMYDIIEDENLTTDAVPDGPRENIPEESVDFEEPKEANKEQYMQYGSRVGFPVNPKKKSTSNNSTKPGKKSNGSSKPFHTCTKVINVSNSSCVHIGTKNYINMFSNSQKSKGYKENSDRTLAVDQILENQQLVKSEHIDFVATHLGEGWRDVGVYLGYSKGQMDNFYLDNKNIGHKEVVYQMLLDWTRVKPEDCKIGVLATALWESNQKDVITRWINNI